jgi:hypothetical protein
MSKNLSVCDNADEVQGRYSSEIQLLFFGR